MGPSIRKTATTPGNEETSPLRLLLCAPGVLAVHFAGLFPILRCCIAGAAPGNERDQQKPVVGISPLSARWAAWYNTGEPQIAPLPVSAGPRPPTPDPS